MADLSETLGSPWQLMATPCHMPTHRPDPGFHFQNCGEILELSDLCGIASLREKYFHVVATNFKQFVETEDYV
jgi:hypothetical protein